MRNIIFLSNVIFIPINIYFARHVLFVAIMETGSLLPIEIQEKMRNRKNDLSVMMRRISSARYVLYCVKLALALTFVVVTLVRYIQQVF